MLFDDPDDDYVPDGAVSVANGAQSLLPPREMADCLGHAAVEAQLAGLIAEERLPHAMIFAGPEGIGKATMAFRLARYLLDKERGEEQEGAGLFGAEELPQEEDKANLYTPPEHRIFRQIASGGHADLLYVQRAYDEKKSRFKAGVDVEEVRKITPFMRKTASQGGWRIVIVDDADTMGRSAQNAILKILEEPPARALLVLVAHRPGSLIPTIRSRARMVNFLPPARDIFEELISRAHPDIAAAEREALYNLSGASAGRALRIMEEGGLEAVAKVVAVLESAPDSHHSHQSWDWPQIHKLADTLARQGEEEAFYAFQTVFMWVIRTFVKSRARGQDLPALLNRPAIEALYRRYDLLQWIEISGNLQDHFDKVQRASLDKRHAVLGAFSHFKDIEKENKEVA